jgi:hypothetical protein
MPSFPDTKGNAEGGEKEEEEEEEEREEEKEGELRKVTEIEADHWPDAGSHRSVSERKSPPRTAGVDKKSLKRPRAGSDGGPSR